MAYILLSYGDVTWRWNEILRFFGMFLSDCTCEYGEDI